MMYRIAEGYAARLPPCGQKASTPFGTKYLEIVSVDLIRPPLNPFGLSGTINMAGIKRGSFRRMPRRFCQNRRCNATEAPSQTRARKILSIAWIDAAAKATWVYFSFLAWQICQSADVAALLGGLSKKRVQGNKCPRGALV